MRSGVAKIVRHSIVEDIGNVLNPVLAHGQIQGGGLEPQTRNLASIAEGRASSARAPLVIGSIAWHLPLALPSTASS
jgi:hypothetical protein